MPKKTVPHIDIQSCSSSLKTKPTRNSPKQNNKKQCISFKVKTPLAAGILTNTRNKTAKLKFEFKPGCIAFNESSNELSDWTPETSSHNVGSSNFQTTGSKTALNRTGKNNKKLRNKDQSTQITSNSSSLYTKNNNNAKTNSFKQSLKMVTIKNKCEELNTREEASSNINS